MTDPRAQSLRVLAGALMAAPAIILLALWFVLPHDGSLSLTVLAGQLVLFVVLHVVLDAVG